MGETAALRPMPTERASAGVGCSRNSRKRSVARSSSSARLGTRRPGAHREPDHHRLDPGFEQRHPDRDSEREVDEPDLHTQRPGHEHGAEQPECRNERRGADLLRVDGRDDDEREDVVDDDDREHERPQPVGETRAHEREQLECEGGVGGHCDSQPCAEERPALKAR